MSETDNNETISLINSVSSLVQSLSFKNLESPEVEEALHRLKKSRGFKKIVGDLSSVHVLKFGAPESHDGSQRLRRANDELDYETVELHSAHDGSLSTYTQARTDLIMFDKFFVLQICKEGKWQDATEEDLP